MELIRQQDKFDCGVANCVMIINHFTKVKTTVEDFKITHEYKREEYSLDKIKGLLNNYSISIDYYEIDSLNNIIEGNTYPVLLVVKNAQDLNHYVLVNSYENGYFEIFDPAYKLKRKLTSKQLEDISLNIAGFIKKDNSYKEQQQLVLFNRNYFKRFWLLAKDNWQWFILINLITVLSLFAFFFSNMFIKVLLTEYAYLTIKRAILIVSLFIGIVTVWVLLLAIQRRLSKYNNQRCINRYLSHLDNEYNLNTISKSFSKEQLLKETNDLLIVLNQQLYLLNNFVGFILFTTAVIYLTANVSLILLIGTLLLIGVLFALKIWQAKRNYSNLQINKLYLQRSNSFISNLVNNFSSLNQRIKLEDYLNLNKEYLTKPNLRSSTFVSYLEKISIYFYYFVMIFCLYTTGLDISLFLVITNITFVFSHQLETILTNINSSFLINRKLKIINGLKKTLLIKNEPSVKSLLTVKKASVKSRVIRVKNLKDVLIDYFPIEKYQDAKQVFDTSLSLIQTEAVSNNLFCFGMNNGLDNFRKFKLNEWLEKLNIDLSVNTYYLNEEQQEFIKLTSCLFSNKPVILIKKQSYKWFLIIERDIKKYLKDKLVIVYE